MPDKAEKVAREPQNVFKPARESDSSSSQKRQKMVVLVRKQGARDSLIEGSAMSEESGKFQEDAPMRKPGSNAPIGGIITSKFFGDDLKVTEILPFSKIQKDTNAEIKGKLVKDILHSELRK
ncbi:hypothetical protein H8958_017250 [Nasalis larvatus]